MNRIIDGVRLFQQSVFPELMDLFGGLARGQHPRALFITCSDSRVVPDLITQSEPGELFVLRNPGNFVPPPGSRCEGVEATVEYALSILKVEHVIVCGHSDCGAMKALLDPQDVSDYPILTAWLRHATDVRRFVEQESHRHADPHQLLSIAIEQNVVRQLDNLRTYPCVASAAVQLHGWVYDIETGEVFAYRPGEERFVPLT